MWSHHYACCMSPQVKAKIPNPKDLEGKLAHGGAHSQVCCKTNSNTKTNRNTKTNTNTWGRRGPQSGMLQDKFKDKDKDKASPWGGLQPGRVQDTTRMYSY